MANQWSVGALVACSAEFKDAAGNYQDPTKVFFKDAAPDGTVTTLEHGVDAALVKDDTGKYHVNVDTTGAEGWRSYRFYSTGVGQAANEGKFLVVTEF
jgi:hypothetical protein